MATSSRAPLGRWACALAVSAIACAGCGGGMPLLHPARTLPAGEVRAAGGMSGNFTVGSLGEDLANARNDAATNPNAPGKPGSDPTFAKGALVAAVAAPGIAPFFSARVGVGGHAEGGISYTGRGARIDLRRSFDLDDRYTFSIGAGLDVPFYGTQQSGSLPDVDLSSLHGYGADVPVLFGYDSAAGLYKLWIGVRAGWEHDAIQTLTSEPRPMLPTEPISLSAARFWAGGVAGIAAGFRHVHVALEIDVAYETISGAYDATQVTVSGVTLAPAAAVWWAF